MTRRLLLLASGTATMMTLALWTLSYGSLFDYSRKGCNFAYFSLDSGLSGGWSWDMVANERRTVSFCGSRGSLTVATRTWEQQPPPYNGSWTAVRYQRVTCISCFEPSPGRTVLRTLVLPFWTVVAVLGLWPLAAILRSPKHRREARRRRGLCTQCGYDLTGNMSGVCPECGQAI